MKQIITIHTTTAMKHFFIYGLTGWMLEIVWTGLGSLVSGDVKLTAKTYLWMFPIYGLVYFFESLHDVIRYLPYWKRGLIWMLLFFSVEYLTGWLLKHLIGTAPWDYSEAPFQLQGLIRFDYAPVWFMAGLLFEKLHDWLATNKPYF